MGKGTSVKNFPGVETRDTSIRISFTLRSGARVKKTYKVNGATMAPTGPNIKAAAALVKDIKAEIELGVFDMAKHFPDDATVLAAAARRRRGPGRWGSNWITGARRCRSSPRR